MTTPGSAPAEVLEHPSDYRGTEDAVVAATQNHELTATQARKLVLEWMDFFSAGPTTIKRLTLGTRTPVRLFETLAGQTQLEQLSVKWGDYSNLSPIACMPKLHTLQIQSAPRVASMEPLDSHPSLRTLEVTGLRDAHDMAPLGTLRNLRSLVLGGEFASDRNAHIDSLSFIKDLPQLRVLKLLGLIVDDKDYSPLLSLRNLTDAWVMKTRGMRPTVDELAQQVPGWDTSPPPLVVICESL
ncbi:hypothetical protein ACX8Z9_13465 [Arthrobacter halodurans]|uniref:Leucine-rich repeat domain-containing protein n=1 Tax=Arthrobacter halodurans TaxID=516699 RepID=A0ABV4UQU5_9MICC